MIGARELTGYVLLAAVLGLILTCGSSSGSRRIWFNKAGENMEYGHAMGIPKRPDFSSCTRVRTLDEDEFPLDAPDRRVVLVGDIHGMYKPFNVLLLKVQYDPKTDVLVHTGDFLSKGLHHQSIEVLDFMTLHNITGVRGNHDQQVIEWRGWINWICSTTEGCDWLKRTEHTWRHMHGKKSFDLDNFLDFQEDLASGKDKQWWKLIPAGWKFLSDHYRIAREMKNEHYEYLLKLPLALYVPSAHAFVVHAGILPSDPRYPYYDTSRQPLARIPNMPLKGPARTPCGRNLLCIVDHLRQIQEQSILADVPQNKKPWVLMNMRSVKNGKVFRKYTGVYWTKLWNREMGMCVGYKHGSPKQHKLPCYPSTIVYGHSASQGFHPKRWSIGLDSGCVYGRSLTAIVLGGHNETNMAVDFVEGDGEGEEKSNVASAVGDDYEQGVDDDDDDDDEHEKEVDDDDDDDDDVSESNKRKQRRKKKKDGDAIPFGDYHKAKIISVKCH